jgi:high-affinity nickel-transport protein
MSLVDSLDSILMLYAYATPHVSSDSKKFAIFATPTPTKHDVELSGVNEMAFTTTAQTDTAQEDTKNVVETLDPHTNPLSREPEVLVSKADTMSSLSITLTVLSILVALRYIYLMKALVWELRFLSISLIEVMGLIGDNCSTCLAAANDTTGGGLAGSWWRFWAEVLIFRP